MSSSFSESALVSRFAGPGLVVVLAVLFAGRAGVPRYVSARPAWGSERSGDPQGGILDALLTEDPLAVSAQAEAGFKTKADRGRLTLELPRPAPQASHAEPAGGEPACTLTGCRDCLRTKVAEEHERVLLLVELLRSGDRDEDRERRVRNRQATLYGLLDAGYRPVEAHAMRYFRLGERAIPYEWFSDATPGKDECRKVLVLWLDEGADGGKPLSTLLHTLAAVTTPEKLPRIEVIGPTSTDEMLELVHDPAWNGAEAQSMPMRILSPAATASSLFAADIEGLNGLPGGKVKIHSTIGDDQMLARLLLSELSERIPALMPQRGSAGAHPAMRFTRFLLPGFGPKHAPEKVKVAILVEANTRYGLEWVKSFDKAKAVLGIEPDIKPFRFVSPIDGLDVATSELRSADALDPDYPLGPTQIDYLRRMADQLYASADDGEVAYDAIGIFATDVYDTLLILQALRPRFSHSLFFTTDLDARLFHEEHLPYTRNLVVASHFDLSVGRKKGQCVEFRDTYQSSVYRALSCALNGTATTVPPVPRLHEIGRTRAVALNLPAGGRLEGGYDHQVPERSRIVRISRDVLSTAKAACAWLFRPRNVLHAASPAGQDATSAAGDAPGSDPPGSTPALYFAGLSGVAILLLLGFMTYVRVGQHRGPRWQLVLLVALLGVALSILILGSPGPAGFAEEPLVFDQGVSIWPSVLLRLGVLLYCLLAIARVQSLLRSGAEELRAENWISEEGRPEPKAKDVWCWLFDVGRPRTLHLGGAWAQMEKFIRSRWLLAARLAAYAFLIYLLASPFYLLSTPLPVPVRGALAYTIERWTLLLSLFAFFALFAYVLEATLLAARLIVRIADARTSRLPLLLLRASGGARTRSENQREVIQWRTLEYRLRFDIVRDVTSRVENLVYLPMVAVCLLILARASLIDAWSWPSVLVGTLLVFFLLLLTCVVVLRRVVRKLLATALDHVQEQRLRLLGDEPARKRLDLIREHLLAFRGGAFSPLLENPLIRCALVIATTVLALEKDLVPNLLQWI